CGYQSLDENGVFVNVNQTELDWFGYSREELIGTKAFSELLTPQSQQLFAQCFPLFKEQGWIKDVEFDVICKDGYILPVLLNATAIYDGDGKFLQSRTTMFDITDRRKAEVALLRSRDDLSAANVALERAARLKDEFMANMSHELRTPLNAILGLSESLNEQVAGPLNEKQQRYIQTINESGRHLLQLINDILDLAKIEAGQIVLHLSRVDLRAVCESSLVLVKQLAHRKNQHIEYQMDEGIKYILADERSLKQMLVNLLSNAIKFTADGEKLGLVAQLDKAEKKVMLTVWDHGIGIAETDLERLFKPFVQLNAGLTRETTGTGLGLALVASMARLHGGSVGVESHPGQGSRFTIALPWEPVVEADTLSKLKISSKFRAINPNAPRQTILLVEDTDAVIMLVKDFLELAGYNVEVARNGYDGMTLAEKIHPSLILMDVQMPGMDGLETTRRIRANPVIKEIPVIALTALAMPGDRMRCLEAGMDEYISKPINLNSFTKTIDRLLQAQQERKPA
ncbi:MAG TPA: response regulator, partial [Anaerolineales bacterium]|nr:response regulator [Anaerolineales bacterium]